MSQQMKINYYQLHKTVVIPMQMHAMFYSNKLQKVYFLEIYRPLKFINKPHKTVTYKM